MRFAGRRPVAFAMVALLVAGVAAWVLWPSAPVRALDRKITVVDGPRDDQRVTLDATFFPPEGGGRAPVVLLAHGFGGSKRSVRAEAERLAGQGYAVLTWSARGFGASTGQIALNSPDYEVKDVRQLIDWVAGRPEVLLDGPGDPRLGMAGGSYGGAISLMAAAYDRRIDAIVPQITWHDLADALFPDATGRGPEQGVFKRMWAGLFFGMGSGSPLAGAGLGAPGGDDAAGAGGEEGEAGAGAPGAGAGAAAGDVRCGRFLPEICRMYEEVAESGRASAGAVETLRRSSPVSVPGRIRVPTLLIQGQRDSLFPLGHADANARAIAATGAPVEVAWFAGGHDGGGEPDWVAERTTRWFDRWLKKDGSPAGDAFTVTRDGGRDPGTRRPIQLHATTARYAGLAGTERRTVPLAGPEQQVATPPGGAPAGISSVPGVGSLLGNLGDAGLALDMPGQSAAFQSPPLGAPLEVTGASSVQVKVYGEGEVTLFAKLYDVAGARPALPQGLVAPLRVTATAAGTPVTVALPAIDHRFEAGHRLRVVLTTSDLGYALPVAGAVHRIGLAAPALSVPVVPSLRAAAAGPAWWTWALPLAALAVAAGLLLAGRTRREEEPDPELAEVPLQITGLTKRYRDGEKAVDDLSFRVEQGQVLGLLGPNGAGKTTTMRMMMGLIHPDAGEIRIFGHRVTPGAPVLARLGSFVEGPGFLPHLSGRENLELYWRATGRPAEESHLAEALEIAGLGAALERAVRTYSQGMRQRLAIAQAMLGLPDLLVLDEPTNGLDPPQIAEMRRVLIRYAARGRTVIVSSHLLAEVEQTCGHVVVMNRGRLVAAGPVGDLLGRATRGNGSSGRLEDVFLELIGDKA
ncbi:ABC transporter ATP-binding protein [Sphaerisporangium rufum]|uniref:ABC transporter ATP-binding protein n=1 Tax=Sphaerisporangium rufum TaxID=1381558 RepID=A0A919QYD1_9ACTN|nr:alpha/beta fold hydrolase [Sphaerisporangium rufum]GII76339.1 ABC transporter ATP-binding protein [Sphaerisporangium rufum]